uniref:Ig-like domain-containing protein n=1 Tax=Callorhinchus milii TaxID=7868 RepID=A0A4W3HMH6_CALMI
MASVVFYCFSLVGMLSTVVDGISVQVTQLPKHTTVIKGESITFYCAISYFEENSRTKVYWWKHGEREYLQTRPDARKIFDIEKGGSGFFQLLDVNLQDSGVYHCALALEGKIAKNGTGSNLTVCVPPTPLKIIPRFTKRNASVSLTLVCQTAEYYPKNLILTWYNSVTEITTGINTTEQQNPGGLYVTSSSMEVAQPILRGAVYTCKVSHISLKASEIAEYKVQLPEHSEKGFDYWIVGYAVAALIFLVVLIIIGKRCKWMKWRGSHKEINGSHRSGEQVTLYNLSQQVCHLAEIDGINRDYSL